MTRVVSRALQPLCTSTALGKDWIPRLSVSSFERIRDDMVRNKLRRCVTGTIAALPLLHGVVAPGGPDAEGWAFGVVASLTPT